MTLGIAKFVKIDPKYIAGLGGNIRFDVHTKFTSKKDDEPLLLFPSGTSTRKISKVLKETGHKNLCIKEEDYNSYWNFIQDSIEEVVDNDDIPLEKKSAIIYNCAADTMKSIFDDPRSGENVNKAKGVTDNIVKLALKNDQSIPSLLKLGSHDYYTFTHCVNVSVFSIGLWQRIVNGSEEELKAFALGCILHDIGKSEIDNKILNKPGKLTDEEFKTIQDHPKIGFDMMTGAVSEISLDVILHHHEKYNGMGYPLGLKENSLSDNARIASISDVYDALTTKRSYSSARKPFDAILLMKEKMVGHFEQEKVIKFIHFLSGN